MTYSAVMRSLHLIVFLLFSGSVISESAIDYMPLESGNQWVYYGTNGTQTQTVGSGYSYVNSIPTKVISSTNGDAIYMTNDIYGIRQHKATQPGYSETYSSPIRYAYAQVDVGSTTSGSGTASVQSTQLGNFTVPYTYTSNVIQKSNITVNAGTFDTYEVRVTIIIDGYMNGGLYHGYPVYSYQTQTYWVAKGIGYVKRVVNVDGDVTTDYLASTNLDDDGDTVADKFDNCPNVSNKNQSNYDGDSSGDACDDDDDNDGVLDINDEFPFDENESVDTDQDGIGNNADTDDDNDGMTDVYEIANGLKPLVNDADDDLDGDGCTNIDEFDAGTAANDSDDYPRSGAWRAVIPYILNQ